MTHETELTGRWALILGASSGFGRAASLELARRGMHIFGVHLDLKATLPLAKQTISEVEAMGQQAVFFNTNAADSEKRAKVLDKIQEKLAADGGPQTIHLMMHSLAFGTLLPLIGDNLDETISSAQMDMTLNVMAHSLVYWTQDLMRRRLLARGSRIFSMTSSGSHRIFARYGAVAGVMVNCIQAGVTDTPALRRIPGHERLLEFAHNFNPSGRITTEPDVAVTIAALADPRVQWISGSVITVDGAEDVVGG